MIGRLCVVALVCSWLCACSSVEPVPSDAQTHWLRSCESDAQCGALACICGVCIAACDGAGQCDVRGRTTECRERTAAPVIAMCGAQAPRPICLESCRAGCPPDQRCEDGVCVIDPEERDAGGQQSDAGSGTDAGEGDAGESDTGAPDAASEADAGTADAASASDAAASFTCSELPAVSPRFDRSCDRAADCSHVTQQVDCCGTLHVTGIRAGEVERFSQAALAWTQACVDTLQFPQCGCAARDTFADDGSSVPSGALLPATVECVAGSCSTAFIEPTTACGSSGLSCDAISEVCVAKPLGPALQYSCEPLPPRCGQDRSCACTGEALCPGGLGPCSERGPNSIECTCPSCV